jgi:aconitate hydratase
MSGALDPVIQQEIIDRDLYATAVLSGNRNFDGRIHPYAKQAFLASPPLVVAYAIAGTIRFDIEKDVLGVGRRQGNPPEGHLAERRRDRRHRRLR